MNIKENALKARKFVAAHPVEILTTVAAFTAGIAATKFYQDNDFGNTVHFTVDKKTLNKVADDKGAVVFDTYKGHNYALVNSPFS